MDINGPLTYDASSPFQFQQVVPSINYQIWNAIVIFCECGILAYFVD